MSITGAAAVAAICSAIASFLMVLAQFGNLYTQKKSTAGNKSIRLYR